MRIETHTTTRQMAEAAAKAAVDALSSAIRERGSVTFVAATGASQLDFLEILTSSPGVDWSKTTMFHLDEYIALSAQHPASFRRYMQERLISNIQLGAYHLINGDASSPDMEVERLNELIAAQPIDVAFTGIGENAHLAFNDPPADFETEAPYLVVSLDKRCRGQQVSEGWFERIEDVPKRAITMSIRQIMRAEKIICTVPGERKAEAVKDCFETECVFPDYPASILKTHANVHIYLDRAAASLLNSERYNSM